MSVRYNTPFGSANVTQEDGEIVFDWDAGFVGSEDALLDLEDTFYGITGKVDNIEVFSKIIVDSDGDWNTELRI